MTKQEKTEVIEKILSTLSRQKFADWYNTGNFDKWITGDLPKVPQNQVKKDIAQMFDLQ
jgi:hypothetical protein